MTSSEEKSVFAAAAELIAAFGRHDRDAYFACFAPEATFEFYTQPRRLESRAEYLQEWLRWEAEEDFRVTRCLSSDQRVDCLDGSALFSHEVCTHLTNKTGDHIVFERETIVFKRQQSGQWIAVHEHLSPQPGASALAPSRKVTCADVLVQLLWQHGVEIVFGIPGVHTLELYRSLGQSELRHLTPRHEQGAGFAADGYARVSGKPGVCFVTTGPGVTNIVTAMAQAYADSIPMLVISSVNASHRLGRESGYLHELRSQQNLVSGVCAFSHTLLSVDALPEVLARAFATFASGRPRPVHIEVPIDVLEADAAHVPAIATALPAPPAPAPDIIQSAARVLSQSRRPLILAGGGAIGAAAPLRRLAEQLDAPVQLTINGKGLLPGDHPLLAGSIQSTLAGRKLAREADVVLAIGTELGESDYDTVFDGGFKIDGRLIRVDIDASQCHRNFTPHIAIAADAGLTLLALCDAVEQAASGPGWGPRRAQAARAAAQAELGDDGRRMAFLIDQVARRLPEAIFVGDSTQPVYFGNQSYDPPAPRRWFNSSTGYGTLGYALPAAIGAQIAAPTQPVVVLVGDGGLMFTLAELASAVEAALPLVVIVWNNQGYGEIRRFMQDRKIRSIGTDLFTPDLTVIARGFGCHAERVNNPAELDQALARLVNRKAPTVIEICEATWLHRDPPPASIS